MKGIAESIKKISDEQNDVDAQQRALLLSVPNVPLTHVLTVPMRQIMLWFVSSVLRRSETSMLSLMTFGQLKRGFWTKKEQPSSPGLVFRFIEELLRVLSELSFIYA